MFYRNILLFLSVTCCVSCSTSLPPDVAAAYKTLPEEVDFNQHVKPLLSDRCFSCHGPDKGKQKAGLRLDIPDSAYSELPESPGKRAIVPGNPGKSELFHRIMSADPEYLMPEPSSHLTLSAYEKALLVKWIETGAAYKPHWAFIRPEKSEVPRIPGDRSTKNPIDNFIIDRLTKEKMSLAPEADKEILFRRLTFDLTGLPPTIGETDAFINDNSPDAYEKQVDRLLASPHYGEKMAVDWLDVARFADSHGYTVDRLRDMSPWRDWVIRAFNQNLPYNDFITWQLAGDMLPHPTRDQLIATAFNRNHQHNVEGGIVEEEFLAEYVSDRTNTTGEAFMALTIGCARCHDHKFDPISQKAYYQMSAFFNNVKEAGQISWDDAMPVPTMMLPDSASEQILSYIRNLEKQKLSSLSDTLRWETSLFEKWLQKGEYQKYLRLKTADDAVAIFPLRNSSLRNTITPAESGSMQREGNTPEKPVFVKTERGGALSFDGDAWLKLGSVGKYKRSDAFSVGAWVKVPGGLKKGVIFHRGLMQVTYNYRGFHLAIDDGKLQLEMAHTAPYNAIIEYTTADIPRDRWIHLTVTYNGSSAASGFKVFLNGSEMPTKVDQDNLYKDIMFFDKGMQPGIQFGAWERGKGLVKGLVNDITVFSRNLSSLEVLQLADPDAFLKIVRTAPGGLAADQKEKLKEFYFLNISPAARKLRSELQEIRSAFTDSIEKVPEIMIMQEMPVQRPTYVLDRGLYDMPKERVFPDAPSSILPMPANLPKNRLGLAQWLTHPDHPLTARVAVNRYWQSFFGRGLVKSAEDFGNQGEMPSHPQLLDWLAVSFMEGGWNVKALHKLIVMSATYRQSSASRKSMSADPENRHLARGPANRLTAEMLRDNALAASGLISPRIGGRSVYPYQPEGLWKINGAEYRQDTGANLYRRSIYTVWKRSVPHPTQATFDVGIRTSCVVGRQKTNTPLQALIILNDPTFVEASKVMGEQMANDKDGRLAISTAFRKLTGRHPLHEELKLLEELREKQYRRFSADKRKTRGWLHAGHYQVDSTQDPAMIAANAVVASTIMNTDASITKR